MRGRKPDAMAVRRERDHVDLQAQVIGGTVAKPLSVAQNDKLSKIWDETVGAGLAFKPEDAPLLEQFVFDVGMVDECRKNLIDKDGKLNPFIEVEDKNGNIELADNPYYRKMRELTADSLKLANDLGLTPLARARLGLTQASTKAVNISIADTIRKAMERDGDV